MHEVGVEENGREQSIDLPASDPRVVIASVVLSCRILYLEQVGWLLVDSFAEFEDEEGYIC